MKIEQIVNLLNAQVLVNPGLDGVEFECACGADLMSDVLAFVKHHALLLTGLINPHVVRTADMMDIQCIIFVRGKIPPQEVLDVARENGIALLTTRQTMFTACGLLYTNGLTGSASE